MKKIHWLFTLVFLSSLLLAACKPVNPDTCAAENIKESIKPYQALLFAFDDTTALANILPKEQLVTPIMDLQKTRRELEMMDAPACMTTLQQAGVNYMNSVITYMGYFLVGVDQQTMTSAVAGSNSLRVAYEKERARLLGLDFTVPSTATPGSVPAMQAPTPETQVTANAITLTVTNITTKPINLRSAPLVSDSEILASLPAGASATAISRVVTSDWLLLYYEGKQMWVYAPLVQVDGDINTLPIYGQTP